MNSLSGSFIDYQKAGAGSEATLATRVTSPLSLLAEENTTPANLRVLVFSLTSQLESIHSEAIPTFVPLVLFQTLYFRWL